MLETALANLRFGMSMVLGRPFHRRSLDRILEAVRATHQEFGTIGVGAEDLLGGPTLDDETRKVMQGRRFRAQATRAARETRYYRALFERIGIDPGGLRYDDIAGLPVTPKEDLRDHGEAFVRSGARPAYRSTTTGTTGWPTTVWFSDDENHLIGALSTITFLGQRIIQPEDFVQISISTRARLGVHGVAFSASAIGAVVHPAGLVSAEHTLALLTERHSLPGKKSRVSVMSTYPSFLGELVECGLRLGHRPQDFGLERVLLGGEIVSQAVQQRAQELFGPIQFVQNYGMTELVPFGASMCDQNHLHYEPSVGLVEVLDLESQQRPAAEGEAGVIVATPLPPFRETTMLLRYNTEDVVRPMSGRLDCSLRRVPATTNLLGKARLSVRHDEGWTFVRDVLESLEAVPEVPLPARYGFWAVPGGVAVEVVGRSTGARARAAVGESLETRGIPLRHLDVVAEPGELTHPLPLRCDLKEGSLAKLSQRPPQVAGSAVAEQVLTGGVN
jgi:phenylacetate-coenzyme A ligase PaaK-like adenylate-forming protein